MGMSLVLWSIMMICGLKIARQMDFICKFADDFNK